MTVGKKALRLVPALVMTGVIFASASLPGRHLPSFLHGGVDKYAHALFYGILAAAYLFAFGPAQARRSPLRTGLTTLFICLIYGGLEEWYQGLIPGRRQDSADLQADMAGAGLMILLWFIYLFSRSSQASSPQERSIDQKDL